MFAYVQFLKECPRHAKKKIVDIKKIRHFDRQKHSSKKKYYVYCGCSDYCLATVIFIEETEEKLRGKIDNCRPSIMPKRLLDSASDITSDEVFEDNKSDENKENIVKKKKRRDPLTAEKLKKKLQQRVVTSDDIEMDIVYLPYSRSAKELSCYDDYDEIYYDGQNVPGTSTGTKRVNKLFLTPDFHKQTVSNATYSRWMKYSMKSETRNPDSKKLKIMTEVCALSETEVNEINILGGKEQNINFENRVHLEEVTDVSNISLTNVNNVQENIESKIYKHISKESSSLIEEFEEHVDRNKAFESSNSSNSDYTFEYCPEEQYSFDNTIMFPEAGLSVSDVLLMVVGYCLRFNISQADREALVDMIKVFAGCNFESWKISHYMLSKLYEPSTERATVCYFCPSCNSKLCSIQLKCNNEKLHETCNNCAITYDLTTQTLNHYIIVDMKYQLQQLLNRADIQQLFFYNITEIRETENRNINVIRDIYDSELYQTVQTEVPGTLTFNFNTDGAPLFHSSGRNFWPLQVILNELPPQLRFKNIILAGMWITKGEPSSALMNCYMSDFVQQCKMLRDEGIHITNSITGKKHKFILIPLCASVDSVARPLIQNRVKFNGYSGCSWCYSHGEYVAGSVRYFFNASEEDDELRSDRKHFADMNEAIAMRKTIRGVKGISVLSEKLDTLDSVWGYPYEYMHGAILGVTEQFWNFWTKPNKSCYISLKNRQRINCMLTGIKVPHEIHRLPRSLNEKAKWKATEWRSFLLFYAFPCLHKILPQEYLEHFLLFSRSIYVLLKSTITNEEIRQCKADLFTFVGQTELLYGDAFITFNIHALLHIAISVRKSGPLWATSTFAFENGIYLCKKFINGPKGVDQQVVKKWLQMVTYQTSVHSISRSEECEQYCKQLFSKHSLNVPCTIRTVHGNIQFLGASYVDETAICYIKTILNDDNVRSILYNRCIYNNTIFHSTTYKPKKTNDTVVILKCKTVIQILHFVVICKECYVLALKFFIAPIKSEVDVPHMKEVIRKAVNVDMYCIEDIDGKIVHIEIEKKKSYVCELPNTLEIQ